MLWKVVIKQKKYYMVGVVSGIISNFVYVL